jgi:hypothetical protein
LQGLIKHGGVLRVGPSVVRRRGRLALAWRSRGLARP